MKSSFFDYLSGGIPGGIWLLLLLLAISWFVLWFVYYFSGILARRRFWLWGLRLTLLLSVLYLFFWLRFPPVGERLRILLISREPLTDSDSSAQTYAAGYLLYSRLCVNLAPDRFIVYPLDYSLQITNWDSSGHLDHYNQLVRYMAASYVVSFCHSHSDGALQASLLPADSSAVPLLTMNIDFSAAVIQTFADRVVQVCDHQKKIKNLVFSPLLAKSWSPAAWTAWGRGRLAWLHQDLLIAHDHYQHCLASDSHFSPAYLGMAQIELDSALVIQTNGGYYQEHLALAFNYLYLFKKGGYDHFEAARLWGEYAILAENFVLAEQNLKQCLRLNPNDDKAYLDLARLHPSRYRDLNILNEEGLYQRALFLNPGSVSARIWYGDYLYRAGRVREALQLDQDFLTVFPNQVDLQMALGKLLISLQSYQQASDLFEKLLHSAPRYTELLRYNLAIVYFHRGDTLSAQKIFTEIAAAHGNPDVYLYLAAIAEKRGNLDLAIEYLRQRIQKNRGLNDRYKEEARKNLVRLLKQRGEPME